MELIPSELPKSPLRVDIAVEPAYNALNSMALLNQVERWPALNEWVIQTAAALSEQQRRWNMLYFSALRGALLFDGEWADFPSYLDDLTAQPSDRVRDRALRWLARDDHEATLLLEDMAQFALRVREQSDVDDALITDAHALLQRPAELHDQLVDHLRGVWEQHLAAEWRRAAGFMQGQTRAMLNNRLPEWKRAHLSARGLPTTPDQYLPAGVMSIEENLRLLVAGPVWSDPAVLAAPIARVVYVNSPHTGRYVTFLIAGTTLRIFFNAVRNLPAIMRTTPVGRTELASRLNALADETRLAVLALFAEQDALTAQEVMARLDLSQSNASRQLKALGMYLGESRGKGANKIYQISPAQLELTFYAAHESTASGAQAADYHDARMDQPELLRRYMNAAGKLTMLPVRQQDRQAALAHIAAKFEPGRSYSEKEVNVIIGEQIAFQDFVTIRRELYNARYIGRERDGSRYWLESTAPEKMVDAE